MTLYQRALDMRTDLVRQWNSPAGEELAERMAARVGSSGILPHIVRHKGEIAIAGFLRTMEVYAVHGDIVDALQMAADKLVGEHAYALRAIDLPQPAGFVYLEHPVHMEDRRVDAISWASSPGQWPDPNHVFLNLWSPTAIPGAPRLVPVVTLPYEMGQTPGDPLQRLCLSFFRFVAMPWISIERRTDRTSSRRAARLKLSGDVNVVIIRRAKRRRSDVGTDSVDSGRRLINRHVVGGHWKRHWYSASRVHRPMWIWDYSRGPDGAPLVVTERVFDVSR